MGTAKVPRSHMLLRYYIVEHTALLEESLDAELERVCGNDECVTLDAFATLMRTNCLRDNESAVRWARVSQSRMQIGILDCRKALQQYAEEAVDDPHPSAEVDEVLDVILQGASLSVSFDDWDDMLEKTARMLRLLRQIR